MITVFQARELGDPGGLSSHKAQLQAPSASATVASFIISAQVFTAFFTGLSSVVAAAKVYFSVRIQLIVVNHADPLRLLAFSSAHKLAHDRMDS